MLHLRTRLFCRSAQALVPQIRGRHIAALSSKAPLALHHPNSQLSRGARRYSSTTEISQGRPAPLSKNDKHHEKQVQWLWPLDPAQLMFVAGHEAGTRFTSPIMTLNSAKPLDIQDVVQALHVLQEKTPVYQICMEEREGNLWWRKKTDIEIDFKVFDKGTNNVDAMNKMWGEGFKRDGPMLKSLLIPAADDEPCLLPEIKKAFPHQYNFATCTHHAIGDGVTLAFHCQLFLDVLNAVIDGRNLDDERFGVFVSNEDITRHDAVIREQLFRDPERFETLKAEVLNTNRAPAILKAFPKPNVDMPTTKFIDNKIDKGLYNVFGDRCKSAGVSVGSGLQAVINTAIVEMMCEAGVNEEYQNICVNLVADLRRYMERRPLFPLGLHTRSIGHLTRTHKDTRKHFWSYANELHKDLSAKIRSGGFLEQEVVRQMILPKVNAQDFYEGSVKLTRDYGFSNVGELSQILTGEGKHVQMTNVRDYSSTHKFIYPIFHQIYSFRGSLKHFVSYATDVISDDTAQIHASKILEVLEAVCKNP